jgi:beta-xylosidase
LPERLRFMPKSNALRIAAVASLAVASLALTSLAVVGAAAAEPSFLPVYPTNFPDAFVLPANGEFIAYATNDGVNLPMATSKDLVHWSAVMDPAQPGKRLDGMPSLAPWVKEGFTWAPEVMRVGGRYLLYYTANNRKLDRQCVGVAVADNPRGPFRDASPAPLVCQIELGGTIDASPFRDGDGKLYLYFKNDGNRVRQRTALWGQALAADGMKIIGAPVKLLTDDHRWQERVIEAPTMVRSPIGLTMFFSGGFFGWTAEDRLSPYAMGYARCSGPLGPCTPAPENPILHSFIDREAGCLSGPGHQSVFTVGQRSFISFHAWAATKACRKLEDKRYLYVAPLFWKDGKPTIGVSVRSSSAAQRK